MRLILRNTTLEHVFKAKEISFSNYGSIDNFSDFNEIVWCYFLDPLHTKSEKENEIERFYTLLKNTLSNLLASQKLFLISIVDLFPIKIETNNFELEYKILEFNKWLIEIAKNNKNVYYIESLKFNYINDDFIDFKYFLTSQIVVSPKIANQYSEWISLEIDKQISISRKKCIVIDLDNTLWKGVLGEEGTFGVKMEGDYPGNVFKWLQKTIIELKKNGIIITIISKNNEDDVKQVWSNNSNFLISEDMLAGYRINWIDKAQNIIDLAAELNIGLDSMVFIDDSPTERSLMKSMIPEVCVPEFPTNEYKILPFFKEIIDTYFQISNLTEEDINKTNQYKENKYRSDFEKKYTNKNKFIKDLEISIDIKPISEINIYRISQLTQKTNQFNCTTVRYDENQINEIIKNGGFIYCLYVKDKFGDYGLTGACIIKQNHDNSLYIDTFLLSCRVLGKDIEKVFINSVLKIHQTHKKSNKIFAEYIKTPKNSQVEEFYDKIGFEKMNTSNNNKKYFLDLKKWRFRKDNSIKVNIYER
jgi:FkbH-like protein